MSVFNFCFGMCSSSRNGEKRKIFSLLSDLSHLAMHSHAATANWKGKGSAGSAVAYGRVCRFYFGPVRNSSLDRSSANPAEFATLFRTRLDLLTFASIRPWIFCTSPPGARKPTGAAESQVFNSKLGCFVTKNKSSRRRQTTSPRVEYSVQFSFRSPKFAHDWHAP